MKSYRVSFTMKRNNQFIPCFMDVFANNQKDAKSAVLTSTYLDSKNPFYPFYMKASRINPDTMCHSIKIGVKA